MEEIQDTAGKTGKEKKAETQKNNELKTKEDKPAQPQPAKT